jgi:hypothetical protein
LMPASRTITVVVPVTPRRQYRPLTLRAFGVKIHPQSVTDAWYAADCPPNFKPPVPFLVRVRWHASRLLRGC